MHDERFVCAKFGEPIETSVYFFEHHRYDAVGARRHRTTRRSALDPGKGQW